MAKIIWLENILIWFNKFTKMENSLKMNIIITNKMDMEDILMTINFISVNIKTANTMA